ncbi:hypothetical protein BMW26_01355 [Microbacterium sp. 1.5R]|nr:hypothetical protein BMW26_01355 [Microbacterium sp. 1.5R]
MHAAIPALPEHDPAVVLTSRLDVVHANRRWSALHEPLIEDRNIARMVFLDPLASRFFVHRRHEQSDVVAALNDAASDAARRAEMQSLVEDLDAGNPDFRRLYAGPGLRPLRRDRYIVRHPQIGPLRFVRRTRQVGPYLLRVCTPTSETDRSLALLDLL